MADYSHRVQRRRIHERAVRARGWLATPVMRLVLPRKKRVELDAVLKYTADLLAPSAEHLAWAPTIGSRVQLTKESWYLTECHNAPLGTVGTVVAHSELNDSDTGVLVDWGAGGSVRCNLDELSLVAR